MVQLMQKTGRPPVRETLAEAYEVRAFRDESEQPEAGLAWPVPEPARPEPGAMQAAKDRVLGHGEQQVLPDDCQFGDNDLCSVET